MRSKRLNGHGKRRAEDVDFENEKGRIRVITLLLSRARDKNNDVMTNGLPDRKDFQSLEYDLGAMHILWRKHLQGLKAIGLTGVDPEDRTETAHCFDNGHGEYDDPTYPPEILKG